MDRLWIGVGLAGGSCGLFEDAIVVLAWSDWVKSKCKIDGNSMSWKQV